MRLWWLSSKLHFKFYTSMLPEWQLHVQLFGDFGLDLWARLVLDQVNYAPGPYLKCTLLQEHVCYVLLEQYGPGAYLTQNILQNYQWSRTIWSLTISQDQNLKKKLAPRNPSLTLVLKMALVWIKSSVLYQCNVLIHFCRYQIPVTFRS